MVFSGEEEESGSVMGNGSGGEGERMKPPLHNFRLPFLKWGNQRSLRCQKIPDNGDRSSPSQREMVSPPENRMTRLRIDGGDDDGIDAVRERLMLDLKVEAGRMKDAIFNKEKENGGEGSAAGEKAWNLRTRRGAVAGESGKGLLKIDEKKTNGSSPLRNVSGGGKLRGGGSPEKKVKFSLSLTKKEIEEDFIEMTGQKPPRRPKKRPRIVQKQMDTLFPGMWLSEVNADSYKVPDDVPENNGKR